MNPVLMKGVKYMANPRILALTAPRQSGKSTTARMVNWFFPEFKVVSFATVLKEVYAERMEITVEEVNRDKEYHRPGIINLSWEYKAIKPSYFADYLLSKHQNDPYICIDDLRFFVELKPLILADALLCKVDRPLELRNIIFTEGVDDEASEIEVAALPNEFFTSFGGEVIDNSQDMPYLRSQVKRIVKDRFNLEPKIGSILRGDRNI